MAEKNENEITKDDACKILIEKIKEINEKSEDYKQENINLTQNIFSILKIDDLEIRHSNFLSWLFDSKLNGKISTRFTIEFLKELNKENILHFNYDFLNGNNFDCKVEREFSLNKTEEDDLLHSRSIDIILTFEKLKQIVVIENKIHSTESEKQLTDYYNGISNLYKNKGYNLNFIYLTLDGETPKLEEDRKHWVSVSYKMVLNALNKIKAKGKRKDISDILVEHYIEILKDKTAKSMNRKKEFWKLYQSSSKEVREVMHEMADMLPRYDERLIKLRESCKQITKYQVSIPEKTRISYPFVEIFEMQELLISKGLDKNFITFFVSNSVGSSRFFLQVNILDGKEHTKELLSIFNREFKDKDVEYKPSSTGEKVLVSHGFGVNEENDEIKKQEEICKKFVDFFNGVEPKGKIDKIFELVRNYQV